MRSCEPGELGKMVGFLQARGLVDDQNGARSRRIGILRNEVRGDRKVVRLANTRVPSLSVGPWPTDL